MQNEQGNWDATCAECSHTMMDHQWGSDTGPDGDEDVRYCPACGSQKLQFNDGAAPSEGPDTSTQ